MGKNNGFNAKMKAKLTKPKRAERSVWAYLALGGAALAAVLLVQWYLSSQAPVNTPFEPPRPKRPKANGSPSGGMRADAQAPKNQPHGIKAKHDSLEWTTLPRDLDACVADQHELMTVPVYWPGFHALCLDAVGTSSVTVLLHARSGKRGDAGTRPATYEAKGGSALAGLVEGLQAELGEHEFEEVDPMISTSLYDFPPNPWKLFTAVGGAVDDDEDLVHLGRGASVYLYTGGQFIWPGRRIGHKVHVPIPVTDGSPGGHKVVTMTTASLRPMALVLSGFLTEAECDFIKKYAANRMVPSGLATMDSTTSEVDVRTSTQTFMERGGSAQILALEERAHNLTRLPYALGENIQVVRYEVGQKYGAHRDFFNPNDYHKQPHMLRMTEYGGRNRLATVFWYLQSVAEGGETFFPRALNEEGKEYNPWNGDHEDCYRGMSVPPVRGNAVLFYSIVPDGRLDERALHGGCKPRGNHVEKWGANQWIWNHPERTSAAAPRRGQRRTKRVGKPGCDDAHENCEYWAKSGECTKNEAYMRASCKASCNLC